MKHDFLKIDQIGRWILVVTGCLQLGLSSSVNATITAGGLAVIGYDDYQGSFTVAALQPIAAGEVVYFTNNGWATSRGMFNGADPAQGAGSESIIKLTTTAAMAKGTVFSTNTSGANYAWDKVSTITGTSNGIATFSNLSLNYNSDQIYAFQGSANNPLLNPTNFVYALHFGSADYPTFSDAVDEMSGGVPPGLSLGDNTASATSTSFHGDADGNHSVWGLNVDSPAIASMQASGAHIDQWLRELADVANWESGPPTVASLRVAPEPNRLMLIGLALIAVVMRRQRSGTLS